MSEFTTAILGIIAGFVIGVWAVNDLFHDRVARGWVSINGTLYLVTPAKPVPAP